MHPSSAHRHSSIDLSFEEGFSFLETERELPRQSTNVPESHWLFEQDGDLDVFLSNSPSQSRQQQATIERTPSYAQQTFTSSIASSKRQSAGYVSPILKKSASTLSPARRILATPPKLNGSYSSKIYTPTTGLVS
jgi:hypothetical protein